MKELAYRLNTHNKTIVQWELKTSCYLLSFPDDSGSWGSGGLFSALSKKSDVIEQQYELAGEMKGMVRLSL